jgi:hypothetical protein
VGPLAALVLAAASEPASLDEIVARVAEAAGSPGRARSSPGRSEPSCASCTWPTSSASGGRGTWVKKLFQRWFRVFS